MKMSMPWASGADRASADGLVGAECWPGQRLSPISGNVTGATAQLPAPVQRHPYSDMSADDYNAEATGTLGLTAAELAPVGNENIIMPITRRQRPEKLCDSTLFRPCCHFTDDDKQRAVRARQNLLHQELRDGFETRAASEAAQPMVDSGSNGKRARGVKLPKPTFALRRNKHGALERRPSFSDCECPMCARSEGQVATGDQESATRKPILAGEGFGPKRVFSSWSD